VDPVPPQTAFVPYFLERNEIVRFKPDHVASVDHDGFSSMGYSSRQAVGGKSVVDQPNSVHPTCADDAIAARVANELRGRIILHHRQGEIPNSHLCLLSYDRLRGTLP
jgi:hypothetical protein